jgi:hypothetical protein
MDEKIPESFDHKQPDLPTLAVDPDPDEVTEKGQKPRKYPEAGTDEDRGASRAGDGEGGRTAP